MNTHRIHSAILGLALTGLTGSLFITGARAQEEESIPAAPGAPDKLIAAPDRKSAPDFTLTDAAGKTLSLSDYKGEVVLLDFWATWCGGCKVEIPWYVEFDQRYRSHGLVVLGVSMDDDGMKVVKPFLAQKHIDYPVVVGTSSIAKQYGLGPMPMTLLIDRDGRIAVTHTGIVNKQDFEAHIQQLLR